MAIVTITIIEGRAPDTKRRLVERLTEAVVETLEAEPRQVRVVINEVKDGDYAVGGKQVFLHPPG
jgi:4-oxalocrotonate tautomerase